MYLPLTLHQATQFISLPNNSTENVGLSKLKAFADDNLNVAKMMEFFFDRLENIVGIGENAGCQHFLLFLRCFLLYQREKFSF